jgi:hypothetical protein
MYATPRDHALPTVLSAVKCMRELMREHGLEGALARCPGTLRQRCVHAAPVPVPVCA